MLDKIIEQKKMRELIIDIMQAGFDVAMGGDAFATQKENKEWQKKEYDKVLEQFTKKIETALKETIEATKNEVESEILEIVIKNAGVKIKDMPAFPPAKIKVKDIIGLVIKIGITKVISEMLVEEIEEHHLDDCHSFDLDGKHYECSCGNDVLVKGFNQCCALQREKAKKLCQ